MKELLLEIGAEEIPSGYITQAMEALGESLTARLDSLGLSHDRPRTFSTPRRLAVVAGNIPERQPKTTTKVYGPPKSAAFGKDGSPTRAALGFAKSKGVDTSAIKSENTVKGEYIYVEIEEGGGKTIDLLTRALPEIIMEIPFPKSMRWGASDLRFTRPIHWITALFGGEVVDFEIDGIKSGAITRGHRFLGSKSITLSGGSDYLSRLEQNFVIADLERRKQTILDSARAAACANGATLVEDNDLALTVACLTEWPIALWGSFDQEFLDLPDELLIASMKNHQKMFSVSGADGSLTNGFIGVSNMKVENDDIVVTGYQRVLRARLADAKFFFDEDRKHSLTSFAEKLNNVVYQKKLGSVREKIVRFSNLSNHLVERINPDLKEVVSRTAELCKADLESLMVYEFPELQGVMGREYARYAGEPEAVCEAIFDHYKPRWSGDDPPSTDAGAIVGISDRIDTLAGCFAIGLIPSGTADPFALRRHALGVITTIIDRKYSLDLDGIFDLAISQLAGKVETDKDQVKRKLMEFLSGRLKNYWTGGGSPTMSQTLSSPPGFVTCLTRNCVVTPCRSLRRGIFSSLWRSHSNAPRT